MAHLHLGLLAYWVVNTIRYQRKSKGINHGWKEFVRIMNTQKAVTATAQNVENQTISIRRCSEPNEKVKQLYDALKYKYPPFTRKKSVVHKKNENQKIASGYKTRISANLAAMWGKLQVLLASCWSCYSWQVFDDNIPHLSAGRVC